MIEQVSNTDRSGAGVAVRTQTDGLDRPRRVRSAPVTWTLPGFCDGMRIGTSFGDLPIQALRKRDPLRTPAGSFAPVVWVDRLQLDDNFLTQNPDAYPVRIPANAFGEGRPERDLLVSPHQLVNVSRSPYAQEFRRARELEALPGVVRQPMETISYFLFHCGERTAVMAEGICVQVNP